MWTPSSASRSSGTVTWRQAGLVGELGGQAGICVCPLNTPKVPLPPARGQWGTLHTNLCLSLEACSSGGLYWALHSADDMVMVHPHVVLCPFLLHVFLQLY